MNYIRITKENIDREHICCAMSGKQSVAKKEWLRQRFDDGLVFYRSEERGKCFIEYIPAEYAWAPIEAEGYMFIDCFWISGQFKGHGYSNQLLDECIGDSKEKGKKALPYCLPKRRRAFCPTQNICNIRALRLRMPLIRILSFGICPFPRMRTSRALSLVSEIRCRNCHPVLPCIIRTSVLLPPSMSRCWKLPPGNPVRNFIRYISPPGNRLKAHLVLLRPLLCITTGS